MKKVLLWVAIAVGVVAVTNWKKNQDRQAESQLWAQARNAVK